MLYISIKIWGDLKREQNNDTFESIEARIILKRIQKMSKILSQR